MTNETGSPRTKPGWVDKADDFTRRHWYQDKPLQKRRGEHIWAIIWNIIFLWVVNKVPDWNLSFITSIFCIVQAFLIYNIFIQIAVNTIMAFLETRWPYYLLRFISEAATFILFIILYYLYPFDFSGTNLTWLDMLIPVIFIIVIIVSAISALVALFRMVFSLH